MGNSLEQHRAAIGSYSSFVFQRLVKLVCKLLGIMIVNRWYGHILSRLMETIVITGLMIILNLLYLIFVLGLLLLIGGIHPNPGPENGEIKMCHFNARSLMTDLDISKLRSSQVSKFDEIEELLVRQGNFQIITVSETYLDNSIPNDYVALDDYQVFRKDRNRRGGGVLAYIHSDIPAIRRDDFEVGNSEILWVQVKIENKIILVCTCYRPPNQTNMEQNEFFENFQTSLNLAIQTNPDSLFCLGDFNDRCTDWGDNHPHSELKTNLRDLVNDHYLFQLVNKPTRITENTAYILDLIITDSPGYISDVDILPPIYNMDHHVVFCQFKFLKPKNKTIVRSVWHYKNGDFDGLNEAFSNAPWDSLFVVFDEIDDIAYAYEELITETAKKFIPFRTIKMRTKDKPWFNSYIRKLIRLRNRWTGVYGKSKKLEHRQLRNWYRNLVKFEIQQAKDLYYTRLKSLLTNTNLTVKKFWSISKSIYGVKVKSGIPTLVDGDREYITDVEKAELMGDHFAAQCSLPPPPPSFSFPTLDKLTNARLTTVEINEEIVYKALCRLDPNKATGPDGIGNHLLKQCSSSLAKPLAKLFRKSLESHTFPSIWKKGNWCPVYKHSAPHSTSNYRPISLLPCLGKVMERIVFTRLYSFLSEQKLLTEHNSGFKSMDSTVNQLIYIVNKIYENLEKGKDICLVFLDVSKAFDKVDHQGLLLKLEQMGIDGDLLLWLNSYLSNRKQRVIINGTCSDWKSINAGVPQGSILGPLLFLVYVNDIVNDIETQIKLFADDTSLLEVIDKDDPLSSFEKINRDLDRLKQWSVQWRSQFNESKSVYMIVTKKKTEPAYPTVMMNNVQLRKVDSHTHLGLTINKNLTWNDHIDRIVTKASKRLDCLKRIRSLVPRSTLEILYKSMVRPVLEYASILYDNLTSYLSIRLENCQRAAALICTCAMQRTSTDALLEELGWASLRERRKYYRLTLFYKMNNQLVPSYLESLLPNQVRNRTRYPLRNADDLDIFLCKKQYRAKSFLPLTTMEWNKLDPSLKSCPSVESFKNNYKRNLFPKYNPLYSLTYTPSHRHHTRLRLKFSQLSQHLFTYNIVESPICPFCELNEETIRHYFLQCPTFGIHRTKLYVAIINILKSDFLCKLTENDLINLLLNGSDSLDFQSNSKIFEAVQVYIEETKRFHMSY